MVESESESKHHPKETNMKIQIQGRFLPQKNLGNLLPIPCSMYGIYLPTLMVDFYGFHVGKYTIHGWYGL